MPIEVTLAPLHNKGRKENTLPPPPSSSISSKAHCSPVHLFPFPHNAPLSLDGKGAQSTDIIPLRAMRRNSQTSTVPSYN